MSFIRNGSLKKSNDIKNKTRYTLFLLRRSPMSLVVEMMLIVMAVPNTTADNNRHIDWPDSTTESPNELNTTPFIWIRIEVGICVFFGNILNKIHTRCGEENHYSAYNRIEGSSTRIITLGNT